MDARFQRIGISLNTLPEAQEIARCGLKAEGTALAGNPLEPQGKVVSGANGRVVSDGPFTESKESIGGYFLLNVATMDQAVAIAQQCPGLPHGIRVEVRPVAPECPIAAEMRADAALAHA